MTLTAEDIRAIVREELERAAAKKGRREPANDAPLTAEDREDARRYVRARSKRLGLRSRAGG